MTRKDFLQGLAIATAGLFLQFAQEKTDLFKKFEEIIGQYSANMWILVGGSEIPAELGMTIDPKYKLQRIGEIDGAPVPLLSSG